MKKWAIALGMLILILGAFAYFRPLGSIETAIQKANPGSSIGYGDPTFTSIPQGHLVWYQKDGKPHVAWVSKTGVSWKVNAQHELPSTPSSSEVAWTAWNPNKAMGLFLAQAPAGISDVHVNGQAANNVPGTRIWWLTFDDLLSPPIDIVAYDADQNVSWRYSTTAQ